MIDSKTEFSPNEAKKMRDEKNPTEAEATDKWWEIDDEPECNFYANAIAIVSWAWMSPEEELEQSVKDLNELIGTGYYDDGDEVLISVRDYLVKRLKKHTPINRGE